MRLFGRSKYLYYSTSTHSLIVFLQNYFRLGINTPSTFFDMTGASKLKPGRHTTFSIRPTKLLADENVKSTLTPLQRNCRFGDELPENMTLFKTYTMAACKFECILTMRYLFFSVHKQKYMRMIFSVRLDFL